MNDGEPINILLAASEVVGFAKTGGLADVAGSLPQALARRGHRCAVIMPLYHGARSAAVAPVPTDHVFSVPVGDRSVPARLWRSSLPGGINVYLVEQDGYFDRDDPAKGRGIYQYTLPDGSRRDYDDNCERFVFFNRAVLEALPYLDFWPDVLHVNDWQTGLIPVYLREEYRPRSDPRRNLHYERVRTLITIHNIAYQGVFWHWDMKLTGLDWRLFNTAQLEFHGKLSLPQGRHRLRRPDQHGQPDLRPGDPDSLLRLRTARRADRATAIGCRASSTASITMSGTRVTTHTSPAHYEPDAIDPGKRLCKADLQRRYG